MYSGGAAPGDTDGRQSGGGLRTFFIISDLAGKQLQLYHLQLAVFKIRYNFNYRIHDINPSF